MPMAKNHPFLSGGPVVCPKCDMKCKNKYGYIQHAYRKHNWDRNTALNELEIEPGPTGPVETLVKQIKEDKPESKIQIGGNKFKIGDVVCLKSGGPGVTVVNLGTETKNPQHHVVEVVWFDDENKLHEEQFPLECLELQFPDDE